MLYALDSNIYIDAQRNRDEREQLRRFSIRTGTRMRFAGVVAMELRAGALTDAQLAVWDALVAPYRARGWVLDLSAAAMIEAGRVLADLRAGSRARDGVSPSLVADTMLAASCREAEATLVTRNARDFSAIQRRMRGFKFVEPWPG